MVNDCICVEVEKCSRGQLQKFASNVHQVMQARKNSPYHRPEAQNEFHLEYFEHLRQRYCEMKADPNRMIAITRYRLPAKFVFDTSKELLLTVVVQGLFRPDEESSVQFANKNVGGGFMTYGLADEEVRCLERTDLGMFVAAKYHKKTPIKIAANEALVITGADVCAGIDFYGRVPEDWPAKSCFFEAPKVIHGSLVVIDCIRPKWKKYKRKHLEWCIKKAYCGFQGVATQEISTGPWGCGAFFNNKNVMFCVQTLAAWLAGKKLFYHGYSAKAYEMVLRWHRKRSAFKSCFNELIYACKNDDEFETSWDPVLVQKQFSGVKLRGHLEAEEYTEDEPRVLKLRNFIEYAEKKWPQYGSGPIIRTHSTEETITVPEELKKPPKSHKFKSSRAETTPREKKKDLVLGDESSPNACSDGSPAPSCAERNTPTRVPRPVLLRSPPSKGTPAREGCAALRPREVDFRRNMSPVKAAFSFPSPSALLRVEPRGTKPLDEPCALSKQERPWIAMRNKEASPSMLAKPRTPSRKMAVAMQAQPARTPGALYSPKKPTETVTPGMRGGRLQTSPDTRKCPARKLLSDAMDSKMPLENPSPSGRQRKIYAPLSSPSELLTWKVDGEIL